MSQSAYLPGPWQIHYHHERHCFRICTKEGTTILELPAQEDEEWRNTLHLLAAAPKLYEALRELLASQEEALLKDGAWLRMRTLQSGSLSCLPSTWKRRRTSCPKGWRSW